MADLIELRNRILAVHNGTLPPDAVSPDELREAIQQLRDDRRRRSTAEPAKASPRSATPALKLDDIPVRPGGLLDLMKKLGD